MMANSEVVPVTIHLLGKEYRVSCPEEEREGLIASAADLHRRMEEIRASGKVFGADRIAVMAALNIAHELLNSKGEAAALENAVGERLRNLDDRLGRALAELEE